eukprot:s4341_g1.t1
MVLLVAIPGSAAEALPEAEWQQVDRSHLSSSQKRKTPGWKLTQEDSRLDRKAMRLGPDGQGSARERDWTTVAPGYCQSTSSRRCAALWPRRASSLGDDWLGREGRVATWAAEALTSQTS